MSGKTVVTCYGCKCQTSSFYKSPQGGLWCDECWENRIRRGIAPQDVETELDKERRLSIAAETKREKKRIKELQRAEKDLDEINLNGLDWRKAMTT
mgnify:CR=1 FL=1